LRLLPNREAWNPYPSAGPKKATALTRSSSSRRDPDRRQRGAAAGAGGHRGSAQPNREIRGAGTPGLPLRAEREPRDAAREIDASGMYVLPGFVDTHGITAIRARPRTRATDTNCGSRTA
jgi:hypothetical protein